MVRRVPHHVLTLGGEPHRPAASESHLMSGRGQLLVDRPEARPRKSGAHPLPRFSLRSRQEREVPMSAGHRPVRGGSDAARHANGPA